MNYVRYEKDVEIQNCLLKRDLRIFVRAFFVKIYIFRFNKKKIIFKPKNPIFTFK